ncbi:hypothetical protein IAQ61_010298 [Plenodomus lingam]|uniref:uncharacterized protein n=1 Tax=Leptosphaeria maculans TaxID=5022 RepID=UPI003320EBDA|nr:hypothetical protein IAQ61_010298 [Plenodomus lingam]
MSSARKKVLFEVRMRMQKAETLENMRLVLRPRLYEPSWEFSVRETRHLYISFTNRSRPKNYLNLRYLKQSSMHLRIWCSSACIKARKCLHTRRIYCFPDIRDTVLHAEYRS